MLAQTSPATAEACGAIKKLSTKEAARMRAEARDKARMDYNSTIYGAREEGFRKGYLKGYLKGFEKGFEKGYLNGFQKGQQKVRLKVARNLLMGKMPVEFVAKNTELPLKEVKQLAASLTD
ncbi:MAG: hypothetical protein LBU79_05990 [Planctomycetota bacterium]|nr:hypothetical protein [Planctomycetota bacterium]